MQAQRSTSDTEKQEETSTPIKKTYSHFRQKPLELHIRKKSITNTENEQKEPDATEKPSERPKRRTILGEQLAERMAKHKARSAEATLEKALAAEVAKQSMPMRQEARFSDVLEHHLLKEIALPTMQPTISSASNKAILGSTSQGQVAPTDEEETVAKEDSTASEAYKLSPEPSETIVRTVSVISRKVRKDSMDAESAKLSMEPSEKIDKAASQLSKEVTRKDSMTDKLSVEASKKIVTSTSQYGKEVTQKDVTIAETDEVVVLSQPSESVDLEGSEDEPIPMTTLHKYSGARSQLELPVLEQNYETGEPIDIKVTMSFQEIQKSVLKTISNAELDKKSVKPPAIHGAKFFDPTPTSPERKLLQSQSEEKDESETSGESSSLVRQESSERKLRFGDEEPRKDISAHLSSKGMRFEYGRCPQACERYLTLEEFATIFVDGITEEALSRERGHRQQSAIKVVEGIEYRLDSEESLSIASIGTYVCVLEWPTIGEFTVDVGTAKIEEYLSYWKFEEEWKFCINFLKAECDAACDFFRYEAIFSIPCKQYPIPQATASVYFTFEKSRVRSPNCLVELSYCFEGQRLIHKPGKFTFQEERLFYIVDAKIKFYKSLTF